jgi:hypothetical protein
VWCVNTTWARYPQVSGFRAFNSVWWQVWSGVTRPFNLDNGISFYSWAAPISAPSPDQSKGNRQMNLIELPHATLSFQDAYKYRNQYISLSLAAELTGCSYHSLYAYATRHHLARTVDKRTTLHIRFGDLLVYLVKREEREQAGINDVYRRNRQ